MALELQAERIKSGQCNNVGYYFCAHNKIRASMIKANYPNVLEENITIEFLLKSL